ncbi:Hsp70 family protein [Streptomyces sp. DSM 44917]|uniref:Hsp70 family protein n=1 Tax=Streptomyces boetiae TaxID=3075541 RepID=A0ABU2L734_9ACTN|nr:Hsp70 family protein [Streptomyces sp. DSM 44917]MDT0307390.1 Hsp70 family protein [Streptomyces sp. DSM 44917]
MSRVAVGIDLGASASSIAVFDPARGGVRVLPGRTGSTRTPSVVAFTEDGRRLVGQAARDRAVLHPAATVERVPVGLGRGWRFEHAGARYEPEDLAAALIAALLDDAERELGERPRSAVFAAPAHLGPEGREALVDAAGRAGLTVPRVIADTVATALAYTAALPPDETRTALIFDLGGGSLGATLADAGDGVCDVLATAGDGALGGALWDQRLAGRLIDGFEELHGAGLRRDVAAVRRVTEAAERAKAELTSAAEATVRVPFLQRARDGRFFDLVDSVTRREFEGLTADLTARCGALLDVLFAAMDPHRDYRPGPGEVEEILIAGEAGRMPAVAALLRARCGGTEPRRTTGPAGAAAGAAWQAALLSGLQGKFLLLDANTATLLAGPVVPAGGAGELTTLVRRGVSIPVRRSAGLELPPGTSAVGLWSGESRTPAGNRLLAVLDLPDPLPPGGGPVEFVLDVDANARLHAAVTHPGTGRTARVMVSRRTAAEAAEAVQAARRGQGPGAGPGAGPPGARRAGSGC